MCDQTDHQKATTLAFVGTGFTAKGVPLAALTATPNPVVLYTAQAKAGAGSTAGTGAKAGATTSAAEQYMTVRPAPSATTLKCSGTVVGALPAGGVCGGINLCGLDEAWPGRGLQVLQGLPGMQAQQRIHVDLRVVIDACMHVPHAHALSG